MSRLFPHCCKVLASLNVYHRSKKPWNFHGMFTYRLLAGPFCEKKHLSTKRPIASRSTLYPHATHQKACEASLGVFWEVNGSDKQQLTSEDEPSKTRPFIKTLKKKGHLGYRYKHIYIYVISENLKGWLLTV